MKIGLNARFLTQPYTGIGQYTRHLLRALAELEAEHEYLLFTPELCDFHLPEHFQQIRVPEGSYRSASLRKAHWEHELVPREMEKSGVDLGHFLYPANPARKVPFPVVVTVHDAIPWRLSAYRKRLRSKLYHAYARRALKKADAIITVSEFSKQELQQTLKLKNKEIHVIYEAPRPLHSTPIAQVALRRPFFLYVGGYDDRKNVPRLITAYLKMIANHNAVDLILVGAKGKGLETHLTSQYLQRLSDNVNLESKGSVIFTPALSDEELMTLYSQASIFVHPSLYEGFNLPLVDAMAHGLPIAASDIPVHREVTGGQALFFNPKSVDSIGLGLHQLLNDDVAKKRFASAAQNFSQNYSWQKCARETVDVYNLFT